MSKKTTYYALVNEFSSRERPGGVLRRVEDDEGKDDEVFSRNLKWELSSLLYSAERGDTMYDFTEISEDEANQIVARIRAEAGTRAE